MLKLYKLLFNSEKKRIYPINDLHDTQQYISIYKLHYKPFSFVKFKNQYKKQVETYIRLSKIYK